MGSFYRGSEMLHHLAMAAAGENRGALVEPADYRQAIAGLMDRVVQARESFLTAIVNRVLEFIGLPQKVLAKILRRVIGKRNKELMGKLFDSFSTTVFPYLALELQELADGEKDPAVAGSLNLVIAGLDANVLYIQAALFAEWLCAQLAELGMGKSSVDGGDDSVQLFRGYPIDWAPVLICEAVIPALAEHKIEHFDRELLEELASVGLIVPARIWRFFSGAGYRAGALGEAYYRAAFGYKARPEATVVSAVPLRQQLQQWKRAKLVHETRQARVAQMLGQLRKSAGFGEGSPSFNEAWLQDQIQSGYLRQLMEELLKHPTAAAVLGYQPGRSWSLHGTTHLTDQDVERVNQLVTGLTTLLRFVEEDVEGRLDLARTVVESFYNLMVGLYNLNERR